MRLYIIAFAVSSLFTTAPAVSQDSGQNPGFVDSFSPTDSSVLNSSLRAWEGRVCPNLGDVARITCEGNFEKVISENTALQRRFETSILLAISPEKAKEFNAVQKGIGLGHAEIVAEIALLGEKYGEQK